MKEEAGKAKKFPSLALSADVVVAIIVLAAAPAALAQGAFADGLFQENLPPASIEGRQASLFVRINPPVLTSDTRQDAFMQFRLFEQNTNETIKFTTFVITVTKGTDPDARPILRDAFHTESGLLTLKIQPREGPIDVQATEEDFLKAWKADPGGTINIRGPILLEGGLYHFRIELLTVDNIRNLFAPGDEPVFDTYLSVGDVYTQDVEHEGQTYPTTVISYYDRVKDFSFDADTTTFNWSMPFDWDTERIESAANIFVHQEIQVPKSFAGVGDAAAFDASVSGIPASGRMLAVDPFSSEENLVVHFLINRNDLLNMANSVDAASGEMRFSLSPSAAGGGDQTSGEIATDTGGIHVLLDWPDQLGSGEEASLGLQFIDAFSGDRMTSDVVYDLRVVDSEGNEVYTIADQTAEGGSDEQTMTFPADETYRIEVEIKAVQADGSTPDLTRNGIARGTVVVPEFPAATMIIAAAGILGTIVAVGRLARKSSQK